MVLARLVWENGGLGLLETMKWLFPPLYMCYSAVRAVCQQKTDSLVFGILRQGGTGMRPWLNSSKTEFALRNYRSTQPHWDKGQIFFLWQDHKNIPRCNKGSELQPGSRERSFLPIILAGQTKDLSPRFPFSFS